MIICQMDLFTYNHQIQQVTDEGVITPIDCAPTDDCMYILLNAAHQLNDNYIHLFGATSYCEPFKEGLLDLAKKNYAYENLIVEVN